MEPAGAVMTARRPVLAQGEQDMSAAVRLNKVQQAVRQTIDEIDRTKQGKRSTIADIAAGSAPLDRFTGLHGHVAALEELITGLREIEARCAQDAEAETAEAAARRARENSPETVERRRQREALAAHDAEGIVRLELSRAASRGVGREFRGQILSDDIVALALKNHIRPGDEQVGEPRFYAIDIEAVRRWAENNASAILHRGPEEFAFRLKLDAQKPRAPTAFDFKVQTAAALPEFAAPSRANRAN